MSDKDECTYNEGRHRWRWDEASNEWFCVHCGEEREEIA